MIHWIYLVGIFGHFQTALIFAKQIAEIKRNILIFGDTFEVRVVESVHDKAFIKQFQRFFQFIAILFDKRSYVEFELVGFATLQKCQAFIISFLEKGRIYILIEIARVVDARHCFCWFTARYFLRSIILFGNVFHRFDYLIDIIMGEVDIRMRIIKLIIISQVLHLIIPIIVSLLATRHSNQQVLHGHSWLLNFDGVHYFMNQYQFEQNHAFLPFFVGAINSIKAILGQYSAIIFFFLLNRCLFALSAWQIWRILTIIARSKDEKLVEVGTIAFLFNPASIFYHVLYTESLFCFVTCLAIRYSLQGKKQWISAILLGLGVCLRSNGMFLAPIIGLQVIHKFLVSVKEMNIAACFRLLMRGGTMLLIIIAPFVIHLVFSYYSICRRNNHPPQVCDNNLPNIYAYVQQKYWNVGLFNYFKPSNAIFISIGTPAILISTWGTLTQYNKKWDINMKGLFLSFISLLVMTICFTNIQSSTRFFSTHPIFYYFIAIYAQKWRIVRFCIILYCLMGMYLYTVGFPWT